MLRGQREQDQQRLELFDCLLEYSTEAFFCIDAHWRLLEVNQRAQVICQKTRAELLGSLIWDAFSFLADSQLELKVREALEQQRELEYTTFASASNSWFAVRIYPVRTGLTIFFQDITMYKRVEEEKQINGSLAQAILDSLDVMMAVLGEDGKIFAVNEAWRRTAQEFCPPDLQERTGVGVDYLQVCREAQGTSAALAPEALAGIEAILQGTQSIFTLEYPCFVPTQQSWYIMDVTPLPMNKGAVVAHIDITERKQLELQMQAQIQKAAQIQLQLLPQELPHVDGLDIYAHCQPAEHVGGDFYDMFSYATHPFAFAIGDVSGKGLPASLLMAMVHAILHMTVHTLSLADPRALLVHMSEDLYNDLTAVEMFVTIFTGCYDPGTQQLFYANAGHSPVIYCPNGGPAILLEADATGLGILPTSYCQNYYLPFHPNDVLVAGTDGLNESFNASGEMFGYERLLKTVEALAKLPARQFGSELLATINQFTQGYKQSDDQTLIVIKRTEERGQHEK